MVTTLVLDIAAFIIIFVDVKGYSQVNECFTTVSDIVFSLEV